MVRVQPGKAWRAETPGWPLTSEMKTMPSSIRTRVSASARERNTL